MLLAAGTVHALSAGTVSWYANSFVRSRACVDTPGRPSLYSPIDIVSLTRMARPRRLHARLSFTNEKTMSLLPPRNRGMYGGFASYSSDDSAESKRERRSWRDPVPACTLEWSCICDLPGRSALLLLRLDLAYCGRSTRRL